MIKKKPLTKNLEDLVEQLASGIQDYPKTDEDTIMQIAEELDDKSILGQKQKCKDSLIEKLGYDVEDGSIESSLQTISEDIIYLTNFGCNLNKVVTKPPSVLAYDIENTMQPRVDYLKSLGVKEKDIGKVITRLPQVLELDIENTMQPRVDYLESIGVKEKDIGKIVTKLPSVLVLDIEKNLKPTIEYFFNKLNSTLQEIVKNPSLITCSLDLRIKPRYLFFESKDMENRYKASSLLSPSDPGLMKNTNQNLEEFKEFKMDYYDELIPEAIAKKDYRLANKACNYARRCTEDENRIKEYNEMKKEIKKLKKLS